MDHRWIRMLGAFQIVGSLMMFTFSLTPHLSDVQFHVNVPISSWVFASISFLAGVLLIGRHESGVSLSLAVQLAQIVSANVGWRYVFLVGPKVTWVIASLGTGLAVGGGGLLALMPVTTDGTLNAIGLAADINFGFMAKPLAEASWTVGINLVPLFFARRLWRLRAGLTAQAGTPTVIVRGAV
jgi:hypothetical protein